MGPWLDRPHMQETDELTHARVAQAAALEGRWWPLVLDGRPFYEKPPLIFWLAGAAARLSGRPYAGWPYRMWTCLAAGACLAVLAWLGMLLGRPAAGLAAAGMLALQGDFIFHARFFSLDTPFLACALASLALSVRASESGRGWAAAGWALAGAAAFKSWFVFALAPAYAWALWRHVPQGRRGRAARALALPALAMLAAWIILYIRWNGWGFLREEWTENFLDRVRGTHCALDPDGHAAFYLKWVLRTAPATVPWALAAPLLLFAKPGPDPASARRGPAFARGWTAAFCLSWLAGLALVRAETINYVLPLEAGVCLAAGLALTEPGLSPARAWAGLGLAAVSLLAALRLWGPGWSMALGGVLGLAWAAAGPTAPAGARGRLGSGVARALTLACGLALTVRLGVEAHRLLTRPLDPNRPIAVLLRAHPARRPGEPLLLVAAASQAPYFYGSYAIHRVAEIPSRRPDEACLVRIHGGWEFFPQGGGPPAWAPDPKAFR